MELIRESNSASVEIFLDILSTVCDQFICRQGMIIFFLLELAMDYQQ
jgi:hypothetical protein